MSEQENRVPQNEFEQLLKDTVTLIEREELKKKFKIWDEQMEEEKKTKFNNLKQSEVNKDVTAAEFYAFMQGRRSEQFEFISQTPANEDGTYFQIWKWAIPGHSTVYNVQCKLETI